MFLRHEIICKGPLKSSLETISVQILSLAQQSLALKQLDYTFRKVIPIEHTLIFFYYGRYCIIVNIYLNTILRSSVHNNHDANQFKV